MIIYICGICLYIWVWTISILWIWNHHNRAYEYELIIYICGGCSYICMFVYKQFRLSEFEIVIYHIHISNIITISVTWIPKSDLKSQNITKLTFRHEGILKIKFLEISIKCIFLDGNKKVDFERKKVGEIMTKSEGKKWIYLNIPMWYIWSSVLKYIFCA